jgi:hypothetical protein
MRLLAVAVAGTRLEYRGVPIPTASWPSLDPRGAYAYSVETRER